MHINKLTLYAVRLREVKVSLFLVVASKPTPNLVGLERLKVSIFLVITIKPDRNAVRVRDEEGATFRKGSSVNLLLTLYAHERLKESRLSIHK